MKIVVWGCRGSICSPGLATIRYGGNTTCLELRNDLNQIVVIDAGSGLRNLGKALTGKKRSSPIVIVFTHAHWDHLIGFPFFDPAHDPSASITLCGGPSAHNSIKQYLSHQMESPYSPVSFDLLKAKFEYGCQCPDIHCSGVLRGFCGCHSIPLNHPNGGFGFKFEDQGKTFVFLTDNELGWPHKGGLDRQHYVEFCRGADLLFHDAQYTDREYKLTRGWGHSTYNDAVNLALDAEVKRLGLFHHDPDRTDDDLDRQVDNCRKKIAKARAAVDCFGVAEGMEIEL
jgi:phosphoribosyl 1,2-cyclic phosphodiesterase